MFARIQCSYINIIMGFFSSLSVVLQFVFIFCFFLFFFFSLRCYPSTFLNREKTQTSNMNPASVVDLCVAYVWYNKSAIRTLTLTNARIFIISYTRESVCLCVVDLVILLFTSSLHSLHVFILSLSYVLIAPHLSHDDDDDDDDEAIMKKRDWMRMNWKKCMIRRRRTILYSKIVELIPRPLAVSAA